MKAISGFRLHLLFLWVALTISFWICGDWVQRNQPVLVLPPDDFAAKLNKQFYRVFSFGQDATGVDLLWIRVLQEADIRHVRKGDHPIAYYIFRLIAELDPAFLETYYSGATYLTAIRDDNEGALELLEKGEKFRLEELPSYPPEFRKKFWPGEWRIPFVLAYVRLFEMDDLPGAAREFRKVAGIAGSPPYLKRLVKRLETQEGTFDVAIRLNAFLKTTVEDPVARRKLEDREIRLLQIHHIFLIDKEFSEYTQKRKIKRNVKAWDAFVRQKGGLAADPRGGQLSLNAEGKIISTVEVMPVFGLGKYEHPSS